MTTTTVTLSAATASPAVAAQFVMVGEDILVNGTIVTVTEVLVSKIFYPGAVWILGVDVEGQAIRCEATVDLMVELYDRDEASRALAHLLSRMGVAA